VIINHYQTGFYGENIQDWDMRKEIRVLIAEDDFLVSQMIRRLLEKPGYAVVGEAADGAEAIEMTEALQPDVVVMDIKMPNVDGIEAAQYIQERCPTPVVVLTAYETQEQVERASEAGVGAYLVKPPNSRDMERAITIAMARFDDMMELRRLNSELQEALDNIRTLRGLLPICASCKKIRDDTGYWHEVEVYVRDHTEAQFSHGLCPDCAKKLYPKYFKED
jgi:AmiR/NasT family two-component response regulator